jgi:CubicO group peptidase (beta-lactamase class C family)
MVKPFAGEALGSQIADRLGSRQGFGNQSEALVPDTPLLLAAMRIIGINHLSSGRCLLHAAVLLLMVIARPSAAQSADMAARIDSIFAHHDHTHTPGCAVGVVRDGEFVFKRGYGMANLEYGVANSAASVFRIGSVSKQFTAAAVVLLEQEGKLSLEDDLRDYLPAMPSYGSPITLRHLLHHTSGVRDYLELMHLSGKRDADFYTDADVIAMLARQDELNFAPGERHLYSNSGYFLLSQIVKQVSGMSLREFAERRIFRPLDMSHTHFHDNHTQIVPHRASGYAITDEGDYRISMTTLGMVGDGGVFTSVDDLLQWERLFHYDPSARSPSEHPAKFWRAMLTRGILNNGDTLDYALGLNHGYYRGLQVVSHSGSFVGFRAQIMRFPSQRLSIICLCNVSTANPSLYARQIADLYLADRMQPAAESNAAPRAAPSAEGESQPEPLSPEQQVEYLGSYYSSELDASYEIYISGTDLKLLVGNDLDGTLRLSAPDEMRRGAIKLRFQRGSDRQISGFLLDGGRVRNLRFARK